MNLKILSKTKTIYFLAIFEWNFIHLSTGEKFIWCLFNAPKQKSRFKYKCWRKNTARHISIEDLPFIISVIESRLNLYKMFFYFYNSRFSGTREKQSFQCRCVFLLCIYFLKSFLVLFAWMFCRKNIVSKVEFWKIWIIFVSDQVLAEFLINSSNCKIMVIKSALKIQ